MSEFPLPIPTLIQEQLATVLCFCLSREKVDELFDYTFSGEWKHLKKIVHDRSEEQATRAVLELALLLRIHDDEGNYSKQEWHKMDDCCSVTNKDGTVEELGVRHAINKIIHAKSYVWHKDGGKLNNGPTLICYGRKEEKWEKTEIQILVLSAICGSFMA